jgi:hypothetical protein
MDLDMIDRALLRAMNLLPPDEFDDLVRTYAERPAARPEEREEIRARVAVLKARMGSAQATPAR